MSATTGRLLDLWLPPEGAGRPLGCIATTFTFDADFFEQQCVGRFLGLDARPGEAATDLGYLIEREEKLAETPVCVVADRGLNPDARSLRWDVLTVAAPTGVMHAKVSVLTWERAVRIVVSSANLTEHAFRRSIELAVAFEARVGADLPQALFDDLLDAVERVVSMAPRSSGTDGPRPRALEIIAAARQRVATFELRERPRRGDPRVTVAMPRAGHDALAALMTTWSGGPPRWATVMSPYFDVTTTPSRAAARLVDVMAKREASVDFVVPVEHLTDRQVALVPRALLDALPDRIERAIHDVKQPNPAEPRRLHGKLILLENDWWIAALVGSSNFSAAGLGLDGGGNVEIGVAIGAARETDVGKALAALVLKGDEVQLEADLEPEEDPEENYPPIPMGFVQALGDPGPPALVTIELDPSRLPAEWWLRTPDGHELIDAATWSQGGAKKVVTVPAPTGSLPFNVVVEWRTEQEPLQKASLPVNVTDPGRLPPPEELRTLPVEALLRALASVRPLHEAIVDAVERHAKTSASNLDDLDPLKRFSPSGQLLHRTREMSAALAGLRERLERPAATLEAFRWRIDGPFGPVEIAEKLIEERRSNRSLEGEEAFMLAEICLTLAAVDLHEASRFIPDQRRAIRRAVRSAVRKLEAMSTGLDNAPALENYVREAFARASR